MKHSINLIPFDNSFFSSYSEFAQSNWGEGCYQAKPEYLDWLYTRNPLPGSQEDFLIAINNDQKVVGSIHKMKIPWEINSEVKIVAAIHNLLVEDQYRRGSGLFLITSSLKGSPHIFIPGVNPPLSDAYKMLRSQEISIEVYRKIIRPVSGLFSIIKHRLHRSNQPAVILCSEDLVCSNSSVKATFNPDNHLIRQAVSSLQLRDKDYLQKISWTPELFSWRFFDDKGPKHLIVFQESAGQLNFLVVSIGHRKGVRVARLIETSVSEPQIFKTLLHQLTGILLKLKVDLILGYALEKNHSQMFSAANWKPLKNLQTKSFIYHQNKKDIFESLSLSVAAGDYGLESINENH